jgi:hypothetical protein
MAYETSLWTTIPTIGMRSHRNSRLRGIGPLHQSNYKDKHATPAIGPGITGRVAITLKDKNHSLNSGAHAWTCSNSARSTNVMLLQYRPRHHRIRPSRGLRVPSPTRITPRTNVFVTLHLFETITLFVLLVQPNQQSSSSVFFLTINQRIVLSTTINQQNEQVV